MIRKDQLPALKTELGQNHPGTGQPYNADPQLAADQLNAENRTISRTTLNAVEIVEALVLGDVTALTADKRANLEMILRLGEAVRVGPQSFARAVLLDCFGVGTTTRTNLFAAVQRTASRAFELFGSDVIAAEVQQARALP